MPGPKLISYVLEKISPSLDFRIGIGEASKRLTES